MDVMSRAPARLQRPLSLLLEAAGEDQVFSTGQARAQGITAADLRRLESARVAVRLGRGWYGVHDPVFVNDVETTGQDFCVRASWGSVVVMVLWGRLIQASAGGAGACGGRVNRCGF